VRYIMHSAVITSPGLWDYKLITPREARAWADAGPYRSTVGYPQAAEALEAILGHPVPVRRVAATLRLTDEALVFRLVFPPGSPLPDPRRRDWIPAAIAEHLYELGLLKRIQ